MREKVVGIVAGSRKCGTTWLYENFRHDPELSVSEAVKESGFFARPDDRDFDYYEGLFPEKPGKKVEVDASLAYSDVSAAKIYDYNPDMKIVLIFREPIEYAVSRYVHLARKGQVSTSDITELLQRDSVLKSELDYRSMMGRYRQFDQKGNLLVLPYEFLKTQPGRFYRTVKSHLIGVTSNGYEPNTDRVNIARDSRWTAMTRLLSATANAARQRRLHLLVNWAKQLGFHRLLEKNLDATELEALRAKVASCMIASHSTSIEIYEQIAKLCLGR